ncbi:MAG: hypothetical protein MJ061_00020 [Mailhella sp.]|nr:hypothetical protein [Mailhella sp.]
MLCLFLAFLAAASSGCSGGIGPMLESIRISGDSSVTVSSGRGMHLHAGQSTTTGPGFRSRPSAPTTQVPPCSQS